MVDWHSFRQVADALNLLAIAVQLAFSLSVLAVIYIYAGFPLCLLLAARGKKSGATRDNGARPLPRVCMVVAAHNEEAVIEEKIRNGLALDYPPEKLTFLYISDSTDRTNDILLRHQSGRIRLKLRTERLAKFPALCASVPACDGEIVVLSDANTYYRPDSIRKLVRHFADPGVGLVTGDVRLMPSQERFGAGEGFYYRYERALQVLESRFWSTVGVDGAMYALRREHFPPQAPRYGINDDLTVGMNVARRGLRLIYEPEAIADESPTPSDEIEFHRKTRIVAFGIQALLHGEGVPRLRQGRLMWVFISHKVLRWLAPLFLLAALIASFAAIFAAGRWWIAPFGAQLAFYLLALAGWKFPSLNGLAFRIPYYFSMVNLAALAGILRGLRSRGAATWKPTRRIQAGPAPEAVQKQ